MDTASPSSPTFISPLKPIRPPKIAPEREALAGWLDYHRAELLSKLNGLTAEQAAQRVVPSPNTLHGLVRHMTKVEFAWFVAVIEHRVEQTGEVAPFGWPERKDGDFLLDDDADLAQDVERYIAACERSREIFAEVALDDVRTHRRFGDLDVRWIMIHLLREYAQHSGHADILRELIDGTTHS